MTKSAKYIILALFFAFICVAGYAKVSFELVKRQNVIAGDKFNLTFRIIVENENLPSDTRMPQAPELAGCTFISGPNTTSSQQQTQIINGQATSMTIIDLGCVYRAGDKPAKVTIPPVSISVGGKKYTSRQGAFEILPPDQRQSSQTNPYSPYQPANPPQSSKSDVNAGKEFFVRVIFSKASVYEQEGIIATTKLYRPNSYKFSLGLDAVPKNPVYEGFLSEELEPNPEGQIENYNGNNYITYELSRVLLFPQKSGKLQVHSGSYTLSIREQVGVISMHGFPTARYEDYSYTTPVTTATLNVKSLPEPRPADFCGAVGSSFSLQAALSPTQLKTNESAKYTLTFSGTGNVKYLTVPDLQFPPTFDAYSPTTDVNTRVSGQSFSGSYKIDYPLVPQEVGNFEIPQRTFSYFNLSTGKYEPLTAQGFTIDVKRGAPVATTTEQKALDTEMKDILHIHQLPSAPTAADAPVALQWWYWALWVLVALILGATVAIYRRHIRLEADVVSRKMSRANRLAAKRFKAADKLMKAHDERFYDELAMALKGYLSDKLSIAPSALISSTIQDKLTELGASQDTINSVIGVLDDCEMARFTPNKSESAMHDLLITATSAIKQIESLKKRGSATAKAVMIALVLAGAANANANVSSQADSAYNAEKYTLAIDLYNQTLTEAGPNADVYYNLGNAHYRSGNIGQAVLAYERALRINPTHADAKTNLNFVKQRLEDKPEDNSSLITRTHRAIVQAQKANTWAWITFGCFVLLCAAGAVYIFCSAVNLRKIGFFGGIILLFVTAYLILVTIGAASRIGDHSEAIVTAPSTLLNSVPRQPKQTETVVPLHQGTKVEIIDSVSTPDDPISPRWYNVSINGSTKAWLRATDVEKI